MICVSLLSFLSNSAAKVTRKVRKQKKDLTFCISEQQKSDILYSCRLQTSPFCLHSDNSLPIFLAKRHESTIDTYDTNKNIL